MRVANDLDCWLISEEISIGLNPDYHAIEIVFQAG